jgi:uncharacterized membrane protein YjjP (DUF1212 family)
MIYLLLVVVLPAFATGGAVSLLASALKVGPRPQLSKVMLAAGLLLATGVAILLLASGGDYSALAAGEAVVIASGVALVGGVVLLVKSPKARRIAALLLLTAYPLLLIGVAVAGNMLSSHPVVWIAINSR